MIGIAAAFQATCSRRAVHAGPFAPGRSGDSRTDHTAVVEKSQRHERSMARIVMKFGGTSVADLDRIRRAAGRVKAEVEAGNHVAGVVSAMAGVTNAIDRKSTRLNSSNQYASRMP